MSCLLPYVSVVSDELFFKESAIAVATTGFALSILNERNEYGNKARGFLHM